MTIKGTLIPIGGNEDKGIETKEQYHLEYIEEGILSNVVRESGGIDASIIVIPTASSIPREVGDNYMDAFKKLGCTNVHVMNIRDRDQSETPENIKRMQEADCVMFSGGNQSNIIEKIGGTTLHKIMMERYQNEHFVIAGTSAGAMCMSHEMITGGSSQESFIKGAVGMGEGMSFIPELIIDSHFIRRGRFGRIAEAVAKYPTLIGIGLSEDTGVIIKNGNDCTVIGSGMVLVFDGTELTHNTEKLLAIGTPMTMANLTVHVLSNSDHFDIIKRKVTVLPIDAPFI
jgi:cyanophycinase